MYWFRIGINGTTNITDNSTGSLEPPGLRAIFEQMRSTEEFFLAPGFYERVRSRIEQIEQQSIWAPLIYCPFPARVAISFLALSLVALSYVFVSEWNSNDRSPPLNDNGLNAIVSPVDVEQQRAAVLMQIAAYERSN